MTGGGDREIAALFDEFVAAFATFDGQRVAQLFVAPGVALRRDGTLQGFACRQEIETYYQSALDRYYGEGCRNCRHRDLVTAPLGLDSAVATATWELLDGAASVISVWRQAYFMVRRAGRWHIFGSAFVSG